MVPGAGLIGTTATDGRQGRLNTARRPVRRGLRQSTGWKPAPDTAEAQCRPGIRARAGPAVTGTAGMRPAGN